MFYWPHCELAEYEKEFVSLYARDGKPGVLRRTYQVLLNSQANPNIPGLEQPQISGQVQISRRSRVYGLSFAGDTCRWRLSIEKASGERYTGVNPGAPQTPSTFPNANTSQAPIVAAMCPGSLYSPLSAIGNPPGNMEITEGVTLQVGAEFRLPLIIEPNWVLTPNDILFFNGVPIESTPPTQLILEIAVHVWEFPGMEQEGC